MIEILIPYIVGVALNRAFNLCVWWMKNLKAGPLGYYREHGPALLATLFLHVPAFVIWYSGMALPLVNGILKAALAGADAIPGVDLSQIQLPTEVTAAVTLVYAWPFDSIVSRAGMYIGSKFAIFGSGNGAATKKEAP